MTTQPQHAFETITPDIAKQWLSKNISNRTIRRKTVETYAREMADGRWVLNGEPIIFSTEGALINGQHRLEAIALSNTPIVSAVLRGMPPEVYGTLDQGSKRSAADDLTARGVHNTLRVAATARILLMWDKNMPTKTASATKYEVVGYIDENPGLPDFVNYVEGRKKDVHVPISALAAVGWMGSQKKEYKDKFTEFLTGLSTGANLDANSPVLALRNYSTNMRAGHVMHGSTWFGLVASCWNDFIDGKPRRVLIRSDKFAWPSEVRGYKVKRDPKKTSSQFTFIGPALREHSAQQPETPKADAA